jgi:hypothetical protein
MSETVSDHRGGNSNAVERDVDEPTEPVFEPRRIDVPSGDLAQGGERDVAVVAERRCERLRHLAWLCVAAKPAQERRLQRGDVVTLRHARQRCLGVA